MRTEREKERVKAAAVEARKKCKMDTKNEYAREKHFFDIYY